MDRTGFLTWITNKASEYNGFDHVRFPETRENKLLYGLSITIWSLVDLLTFSRLVQGRKELQSEVQQH